MLQRLEMRVSFFLIFGISDAFLRDLFWSSNDETAEIAHELADAKAEIRDMNRKLNDLAKKQGTSCENDKKFNLLLLSN